MICFFFFVKQKTAYEMRISDWSSDVCSSDLARAPGTRRTSPSVFVGSQESADRLELGRVVGGRDQQDVVEAEAGQPLQPFAGLFRRADERDFRDRKSVV